MSENETLDNSASQGATRPTFLTVLCILTFIGSGLGVLGSLLGLVGSSVLATFAPAAGGSVITSILALVGSGLCLFGAIQMWGLKKSGFMLYVGGCALGIIVSVMNAMAINSVVSEMTTELNGEFGAEMAAANSAASSLASGAAWTGVAIGTVITLVFVLMYNANKKHLVK